MTTKKRCKGLQAAASMLLEDGVAMVRRGEPVLGLMEERERPSVQAAMAAKRREGPAAEFEVTVVVPARDEARNLSACLESLLRQTEPGFALGRQWEIVVVDDASTDGTRALAEGVFATEAAREPESATGLVVMEAPAWEAGARGTGLGSGTGSASGMTGKSAACWAGAQVARGAWLLFTDADTVHEAGSVSRSLREAERHGVAMLSYSPRQVVDGILQRTVMPLIFSELASVYPPAKVNDAGNPLAAANGQFLLVERETYFDVGGHRGAGMNVVEDVALARLVKRAGKALRLRAAPEAVSARMYRTTGEMVEGWTKNLASLLPSPVSLALWRVLDILLLVGLPVLALGWPGLIWWQQAALWLVWARTLLRFYTRAARSNAGVVDTAISPLGLPLFVFLLMRSTIHSRVRREVWWKGRSYNPNRR